MNWMKRPKTVGIRKRFPARDEMQYALAACMLPIFIWSIINVLKEIPAWILRMSKWDLLGTIAYTQAFALIESMVIFLLILILAIFLPERFFRHKFLALTSTLVVISTFWFILAHFNDEIIRTWGMKQFLPWFFVFGTTLFLSYSLVQRIKVIEEIIDVVVKKVSILSFFYMLIGVMGLFIVVVRNILVVL